MGEGVWRVGIPPAGVIAVTVSDTDTISVAAATVGCLRAGIIATTVSDVVIVSAATENAATTGSTTASNGSCGGEHIGTGAIESCHAIMRSFVHESL